MKRKMLFSEMIPIDINDLLKIFVSQVQFLPSALDIHPMSLSLV